MRRVLQAPPSIVRALGDLKRSVADPARERTRRTRPIYRRDFGRSQSRDDVMRQSDASFISERPGEKRERKREYPHLAYSKVREREGSIHIWRTQKEREQKGSIHIWRAQKEREREGSIHIWRALVSVREREMNIHNWRARERDEHPQLACSREREREREMNIHTCTEKKSTIIYTEEYGAQ